MPEFSVTCSESERESAYKLALELVNSDEYYRVSVVETEDTGDIVAFNVKRRIWSKWETIVLNEENIT